MIFMILLPQQTNVGVEIFWFHTPVLANGGILLDTPSPPDVPGQNGYMVQNKQADTGWSSAHYITDISQFLEE